MVVDKLYADCLAWSHDPERNVVIRSCESTYLRCRHCGLLCMLSTTKRNEWTDQLKRLVESSDEAN